VKTPSRIAKFLKYTLGLDRAVTYTVLARCLGILGSTGTVLMIAHFLSAVEQGYYYVLLSLVSLQVIFELGFSTVIQQLAAHESIHLVSAEFGTLTGSPVAHARLASVLQLIVRWYSRAALLMALCLLAGGWLFFLHRQSAADHVAWQLPYCLAVVACAATFLLVPFHSFLDGCGEVRAVAAMRFRENAAALIMAWSAMLLHHGLYAPAMVIAGEAVVGGHFVWRYRRLLYGLYFHPSSQYAVSWGEEIFPFQWRIGVSWLCAYLTAQAFIPLLFTLRGPVEAGQMGMSLSVTVFMSYLLLSWISTKATPFGQMVASRNFTGLDRLFFHSFRLSLTFLVLLSLTAWIGIVAMQTWFPKLAVRLVNPTVFLLLLFAMLGNYVIQSLAIYLRSFKREPFLGIYMATALISLSAVLLTAKRWGTMGVAISYSLCIGVFGVIAAILVFQWHRQRLLRQPAWARQEDVAG
jgi:hypothetical protein